MFKDLHLSDVVELLLLVVAIFTLFLKASDIITFALIMAAIVIKFLQMDFRN